MTLSQEDAQQEVQLELWLMNVNDVENVGGLLRLSDALGIRHLHLVGETPAPPHKKLSRVARHTDAHVPWTYYEDADELEVIKVLQALQKHSENYLCGLEITNESIELSEIDRILHQHYQNSNNLGAESNPNDSNTKTIHLLLGNEKHGLMNDVVQICHHCVHIPMLGHNSSMNVTQAASIAAWTLLQKVNK